ncbi:fimbrial biogenesis outer membrane usher protein [Betaproteobacteria bacterium SCN1]|nr:fimbrial biogenesis outer membrane usher protein [Betaproteobacteria bacterium SCN1]
MCLAIALLCAAGLTGPALAASPLLLAVRINGAAVGDFVPLLREGDRWFAQAEALARWRIAPAGPARRVDGMDWWALPGMPRLDATTQTLLLDLPASAFDLQRVDLRPARPAAVEAPLTPGLALDYDFNLEAGEGRPQAAALLDFGAFGLARLPGTLRHRMVLRTLPDAGRALRLDTRWRIEQPAQLRAWTFGDTFTCNGDFAGTARFAGVQLATDFGLRPDLVTFPLPALGGSASVPSAVDLLVDGRTVGATQVGSGPFALDNPPLAAGAGEVTVVQQDVLGRARQISVPYYVSPRLLKPGLSDTCLEAGRLRRDYGVRSNDYGGTFSAAGIRRGLTSVLTLAGRVEAGEVSGMQVGMNWLAGRLGVFTLQTAASTGDAGGGSRQALRFERQTRAFSLSAGIETASAGYRRLGGEALPDKRSSLFVGLPVGGANLTLAGIWQDSRTTGPSTRIASASLSMRVASGWFGQFTIQQQDGETTAFAVFTRAFGERRHMALSAQNRHGETLATLQAQSSEPLSGGPGWHVLASAGAHARQVAGMSWLGNAGRFALEAAHESAGDAYALRAGGRGGLVWADGALTVTRGLGEGAIARVSLPGMAHVPILYQHRVVTTTDANGEAWVTGLLPYENNVIALDPRALPIAVRLDREAVVVRPPARTAVTLGFPLTAQRAALVRIVDSAGVPIPLGARARTADGRRLPFGRNGEVYVDRPAAHNRLQVEWPRGQCAIEFEFPPGDDPQPRLGPFVCESLI